MKKSFILILLVILLGCDNGNNEHEIIVVPNNYKGRILVIFNEPNGAPIKYEKNKRIYDIPQDGVLRTQFKANYGSVGLADFYYEKIDEKNRIPAIVDLKIVAENNMVMGFRKGVGIAKKDPADDHNLEFAEFYIGTKSEIEKYLEHAEAIDIFKVIK